MYIMEKKKKNKGVGNYYRLEESWEWCIIQIRCAHPDGILIQGI